MTPTQHRNARNAFVFFIYEDCDFDDCPYHRGTLAQARSLAHRLNLKGLDAVITDQDDNTIETHLVQ